MLRLAISLVWEEEGPYPYLHMVFPQTILQKTHTHYSFGHETIVIVVVLLLEGIQLCRDYVNFYGTYETN